MSTVPGNPAVTTAPGPCAAAQQFTVPALSSKEAPSMTTLTTADATRTDAAAILRAVADLIEARPDIPLPGSRISFYLHGEDAPAAMAAIVSALPCQWHASISRSGEHEWLNLTSDPKGTALLHGTQVSVSAPAADTCIQAGARTVTVWQPSDALTGFLGSEPLGEVA